MHGRHSVKRVVEPATLGRIFPVERVVVTRSAPIERNLVTLFRRAVFPVDFVFHILVFRHFLASFQKLTVLDERRVNRVT